MAETIISRSDVKTEADALVEIDSYIKETDRLLAEMKQGRAEIDLLRQESQESLARIDAAIEKLAMDR